MSRRSIFIEKLREFPGIAFADDEAKAQRGTWRVVKPAQPGNGIARAPGEVSPSEASATGDEGCGPAPLILEIGCWNAEFLARVAAKHPRTKFVGLDWKARPLYLGATHIAARELHNVSLLQGRAQELRSFFADGELDEIWLFHPDPFDDAKQRGMRLMSEEFLQDIHRLLGPGGRFILKTDHREYFDATMRLLESTKGRFAVESIAHRFWEDEAAQAFAQRFTFRGETTHFERRFIARKQPICWLVVSKQG